MKLNELLVLLNENFPPETAIENDRIGLQVECCENIDKILIAFEMTDDVIEECLNLSCNTIITFHPLIYNPLRQILLSDRVGKIVSKLIKNQINLISLHTTFDAHKFGTSRILADLLELQPIDFLINNEKYPEAGMGVICEQNPPISAEKLINKIYSVCNSPIRSTIKPEQKVSRIAIVGGSGMSFVSEVLRKNCDTFITADATYHAFHAEQDKLLLIDVGHYEMEQFVTKGIANILKESFIAQKIDFYVSKIVTNPIKYFPNNEYYSEQQRKLLT